MQRPACSSRRKENLACRESIELPTDLGRSFNRRSDGDRKTSIAMASMNYKEISAIARKRRDALLASFHTFPEVAEAKLPQNLTTYPKSSGLFSSEEIEIIESQAEDIIQKIRDKIWTSLEVTKAFCKSAALAQQLVSTTEPRTSDLWRANTDNRPIA